MTIVVHKAFLAGITFIAISGYARAACPINLTPMPAGRLQRGEIQPVSSIHYLAWDGRAMRVADAGAAVGVTDALSAGAAFRDSAGHGQTETRRYTAHGWQLWGEWQPVQAEDGHMGFALSAEHTGEDIHITSTDATSSYTADPSYTASGAQLHGTAALGDRTVGIQTGLYHCAMNGNSVATVESLGMLAAIPLGKSFSAQPALIGYRDDYEGRHVSYEARLAVRANSSRASLGVEVSLFPRGVPLAGTPLSAAATVGTIYGNSASAQLRTQAVGYVSVSGEYRF